MKILDKDKPFLVICIWNKKMSILNEDIDVKSNILCRKFFNQILNS